MYFVTSVTCVNDVMLHSHVGRLVSMTIPHEKGRACTGRGRFDIDKGVWGGEVSSAGTPTGQARACSSLLHVQRCLCRLMVAKYPATHKQLLHVRKRRLNLIRTPSQTNWSKVVGRSAFAPFAPKCK